MEVGQMEVGQMEVGQMEVGQMEVGQMEVGQMAVGQMSVGRMPVRKTTSGQTLVERPHNVSLNDKSCDVQPNDGCTYDHWSNDACSNAGSRRTNDKKAAYH